MRHIYVLHGKVNYLVVKGKLITVCFLITTSPKSKFLLELVGWLYLISTVFEPSHLHIETPIEDR
jgi:hypothetical protein